MTIEKQVHELEVEVRKLILKLKAAEEKINKQQDVIEILHEWKLAKEGI